MKIGMIGAGKVGCTLGKFLSSGNVCVKGYYSRTPESAIAAAKFTGSRYYDSISSLAGECSVIIITVPDEAIRPVYEQVRECGIENKLICHCSGSLSVNDAFPGIHEAGGRGLSIHPLFPVSTKYETYRELTGAFFCLEGDEEGIETFKPVLSSLGVNVQVIPSDVKARYHAACVMASNLMCALVQESIDQLEECGFSQDLALAAITPLLESNLEHITKESPAGALTGPIERCDAKTVEKHLSVLNGEDRELYRLLSLKLTDVARAKNPGRDYSAIRELLIRPLQPD